MKSTAAKLSALIAVTDWGYDAGYARALPYRYGTYAVWSGAPRTPNRLAIGSRICIGGRRDLNARPPAPKAAIVAIDLSQQIIKMATTMPKRTSANAQEHSE